VLELVNARIIGAAILKSQLRELIAVVVMFLSSKNGRTKVEKSHG
jgi:hypothetical protein